MKAAGRIKLRGIGGLSALSFWIECHTENDSSWGGYDVDIDPNAPFQVFSKERYYLVEDARREVAA